MTTDEIEKLLIIGGLGDSQSAWATVVELLPPYWEVDVVTLGDLVPLDSFDIEKAALGLEQRLGDLGPQTHLIGLSAGAMVALRYAAQNSVASLFLSSPQLAAPRALIKIQNVIFRALPEKTFASAGLTKNQMMSVANSLAEVNLTDEATALDVPTTITCGSKDKLNLTAAKTAHQLIAGSRMKVVKGGRHEWHWQMPEEFARILIDHVERAR